MNPENFNDAYEPPMGPDPDLVYGVPSWTIIGGAAAASMGLAGLLIWAARALR